MKRAYVASFAALAMALATLSSLAAQAPGGRQGRGQGNPMTFEEFAQQYDADKDGKVKLEEIGEQGAQRFSTMDGNRDGEINQEEYAAAAQASRGGGRGGARGGGGGNARGGAGNMGSVDMAEFDKQLQPDNEKLEQQLADFEKKKVGQNGPLTGQYTGYYRSEIDGTIQPYTIAAPEDYDPSRSYILGINLGGFSPQKNLPDTRSSWGSRGNVSVEGYPVIGLFPFGRGGTCYIGLSEEDILHCVFDIAMKEYNIDPNRVYLMGHSMGGYGTWIHGLHYPDLWGGIGVLAGPADMQRFRNLTEGEGDAYSANLLVENAMDMVVHFAHGDADGTVPVANAHAMVEALKTAGVGYQYWENPDMGHLPVILPEQRTDFYAGLYDHPRNPYPAKIEYKTQSARFHRAYWTDIEQMAPGAWTEVKAEVKDGRIEIQTDNVLRLKVTPSSELLPLEGDIAVILDGAEGFKGKASSGEALYFAKSEGKWSAAPAEIPAGEKKPGLAGPIEDAFHSSFLVVAGAGEDAFGGPQQWGRLEALKMLRRTEMPPLGVFHDAPTKNVSDVTEDEIAKKNLVLMGNPATNELLNKIAGELPIQLTDDGISLKGQMYSYERFSLVMIAPNPLASGRYALVWTGPLHNADDSSHLGTAYPYLPDYIVYDRQESKVVESGYFTNGWSL